MMNRIHMLSIGLLASKGFQCYSANKTNDKKCPFIYRQSETNSPESSSLLTILSLNKTSSYMKIVQCRNTNSEAPGRNCHWRRAEKFATHLLIPSIKTYLKAHPERGEERAVKFLISLFFFPYFSPSSLIFWAVSPSSLIFRLSP